MPRQKKIRRCPACGDEHHLYGRADMRWDPEASEWVLADAEDEIDCTSCDWLGSIEDVKVEHERN